MMRRLPSRDVVTSVGYHPVGRNPSSLLWPRSSTSITATELLSAFATYKVLASGESASESGVLPAGALGANAVLMTSRRRLALRSNVMTLLVWPHETNRRLSGVRARSLG